MTTRLDVKVSPKASRNAVTGWMGEVLKISVTAAPERGSCWPMRWVCRDRR